MSQQLRATGWNLQLASCTLTVHDLAEAVGFYRDVLGFEVHTDATQRLSIRLPSQPDVQISLQSPAAEPYVPPADRQLIENLMASGLLGQRLVFLTDDCDATFEHLEAAGAEVMQEPMDHPDGTRDCAFLDPSGNLLRFTLHRNHPTAPG
jgi:catechol 2,3-dioxygenase-like lactoylglutathione lyase family enzyme